MKIGIIGTGNIGGALATAWAKAGHQIFLGARDAENFKGKHLLENENTTAHSIAETIASADVILVATPSHIVQELAGAFADAAGKVLIDATNSVRFKPEPYATAYHAFAALTPCEVVKCFNTTGFENLLDPSYGEQRLDMFMGGDSPKAKEVARALALDVGFEECYDFGGAS